MKDFKDKVAVITGAGSGIGRGLSLHAASLGMRLVLADINQDGFCLLYTSPSPRDLSTSRMPSSA